MKKGDKLFYGWIIVLGGVLIGAATNLLNSIANVVIGLVSEDFSVPRTMFNLATVISMPVVMALSPVAGRYFRTNLSVSAPYTSAVSRRLREGISVPIPKRRL